RSHSNGDERRGHQEDEEETPSRGKLNGLMKLGAVGEREQVDDSVEQESPADSQQHRDESDGRGVWSRLPVPLVSLSAVDHCCLLERNGWCGYRAAARDGGVVLTNVD